MAIQYDTEDQIPAEQRDQYDSFAPDLSKPDEKVWIDKDIKALKLDAFKSQGNLSALTEQMNAFKSQQVEAAKKVQLQADEKIAAKIKELEAAGNTTEAAIVKQQQMESILAQKEDAFTALQTQFNDQTAAIDNGKIHSRAQNLSAKFAKPEHQALVTLGLEQRAKMVDGAMVMHDHEGKAVHYDESVYLAMLNNDPVFKGFAKTIVTTSGLSPQGGDSAHIEGGIPQTLEACKGDRKKEAAYFNAQMKG